MKIAFHTYHFIARGTEVVVLDYALANRRILNNMSIIVSPKKSEKPTNEKVLAKFCKYFPIFFYEDLNDLENICKMESVDALYTIKYGKNDGLILKDIPTLVHCVFTTKEPHGTIYAAVSDSVASHNNSGKKQVVNHIVNLPQEITTNYRKELDIPENAIVFGRHGGDDTFDLGDVRDVIMEIIKSRNDIFFIFAIRPYIFGNINHTQLKFLSSFSDKRIKKKFINTCDAMIHASSLGESVGLSILEFSYCNKPVITWNGGTWHKQHLTNLGDKAILYNSKDELYKILINYKKEDYENKNWNIADKFSPEKIMEEFKSVFLDPVSK